MRRCLLFAAALCLGADPLQGQPLDGFGEPVAEADMLYFAGEPRLAFEMLLELLERRATDYDVLWRAARAGVAVGVGEEGSRAQNRYLDPGLHYARLAVEQRPDGVDGIYWRGAAAGRRALNAGPRYSLELAQVVFDDARRLLQVDSTHAGAHNMLGKLNFEVMVLSGFERMMARVLYGGETIGKMSWDDADAHLSRAVVLAPDNVLYRYDLARLHERRGRRAQAVSELQQVLALPIAQPVDAMLKEWASELLDRIGRD